ncbi:MAG TPA: PA14 domain-containing protein, partial [Thermodesulfobacteriota bacterium]
MHLRSIFRLLLAVSILAGCVALGRIGAIAQTIPTGAFRETVYASADLSGAVRSQRTVNAIAFDYGTTLPAGWPARPFSVRWEGDFTFEAGTYRFTARTDDGMRVWVGDSLVIDQWRQQAPKTYTRDVTVTAGTHRVKVEYNDVAGTGVARLS